MSEKLDYDNFQYYMKMKEITNINLGGLEKIKEIEAPYTTNIKTDITNINKIIVELIPVYEEILKKNNLYELINI